MRKYFEEQSEPETGGSSGWEIVLVAAFVFASVAGVLAELLG